MAFLEVSQWGCWPEAGGWADQDYDLIEDVMTYLRLRRRLAWEIDTGWTPEEPQTLPDGYERIYKVEDLG